MNKGAWGTRLGFYLAAIGSAFGLGNLWRFPYVVTENGGGAFVVVYLLSVLVIGLPFLIGELILGKAFSANPPLQLPKRYSHFLNWATNALCLVVLAYYAVISGWVLHFLMQLSVPLFTGEMLRPEQSLQVLMNNGWLQVMLTSVHLIAAMVIIAQDVEKGIEKWVGVMMPAFAVLLIALAYKSLTLESSAEALRFLLYPNFTHLTLSSLGQAIGHTLFTLGIGFGTLVTFGSYMNQQAYVPNAGFRVASMDSMISIFAGILIFPLLLMNSKGIAGPELMFQTVPLLFAKIPGGHLFGVGFFLCLYIAALGATIGLFESVVANTRKSAGLTRKQSTIWMGTICFLLALAPALSSTVLGSVRLGQRGLLAILDDVLINWVLPVVALIVSMVVVKFINQDKLAAEFVDENKKGTALLFKHWLLVIKYIAPLLIVAGLFLQIIDIFLRN